MFDQSVFVQNSIAESLCLQGAAIAAGLTAFDDLDAVPWGLVALDRSS